MPVERLQKVISNSGFASRRKAEELIKEGRVTVNGQIVNQLGIKVSGNDLIEVDGIRIKYEEKVYFLLNKPRSVITSTSDEKGRKTVIDLIKTDKRIYPVGRLDYDTTGILLLTNDGELTNLMLHPSNQIDKVYIAKVNGLVGKNETTRLARGVFIDGKKTSKARVKVKRFDKRNNVSIVELTIHEGRNHQVKKMFEAIGLTVLKLKRERIDFLDLTGLKSGEYRILNPKEVKKLYFNVQNKKAK